MGCLTITTSRQGGLDVTLSRHDILDASAERREGLGLTTFSRVDFMGMSAERRDGLSVMVSAVCGVGDTTYYLRVSPVEVQWVTEWDTAAYEVESNVSWEVKS